MESWYSSIINALITLLIGIFLTTLLSRLLSKLFGNLASRTSSKTDDFIVDSLVSIIKPIGWIITGSLTWQILPLPEEIESTGLGISKLLFLIILVRLANKVTIRLIQRTSTKLNDQALSTMLASSTPMLRSIVWGIGIIIYLQNIGVQMAALWALLSAGGIGAGLALKEPVQEFFEYITILLDKPFQNGQFINVDNIWATVERVGVRSTRLRSLNGEIIVMSNSLLTKGVISNYAEMKNRRLVHRIGVVYSTSYKKIQSIPLIIKDLIDKIEDVKFDRCSFIGFGDSSLDIEFVYFVTTKDYKKAMKAQENINLEIVRIFELNKIDFAFPTRTVNINENRVN